MSHPDIERRKVVPITKTDRVRAKQTLNEEVDLIVQVVTSGGRKRWLSSNSIWRQADRAARQLNPNKLVLVLIAHDRSFDLDVHNARGLVDLAESVLSDHAARAIKSDGYKAHTFEGRGGADRYYKHSRR